MAKKLPFMQLYVAEYIRDTRMLSLETRAIWMDMLLLMHDSVHRGHLTSPSGKPYTPEQLSKFSACSLDEVTQAIKELDTAGVASRTADGVIYSRRMASEERKRQKCSAAGKLGGNPTLKGEVKGEVKRAYSSSSDSPSEEVRGVGEGETLPTLPAPPKDAFDLAHQWCHQLRRRDAGYPRDKPSDMAHEFCAMIEQGASVKDLLAAVLDKKRDKGEYFWQFKKRWADRPPAQAESAAEIAERNRLEREELEKAKQRAREEYKGDLPKRLGDA